MTPPQSDRHGFNASLTLLSQPLLVGWRHRTTLAFGNLAKVTVFPVVVAAQPQTSSRYPPWRSIFLSNAI